MSGLLDAKRKTVQVWFAPEGTPLPTTANEVLDPEVWTDQPMMVARRPRQQKREPADFAAGPVALPSFYEPAPVVMVMDQFDNGNIVRGVFGSVAIKEDAGGTRVRWYALIPALLPSEDQKVPAQS